MKSLAIIVLSAFSIPAFAAQFGYQIYSINEVGATVSESSPQVMELTVYGKIKGPVNWHSDRVFTFDFSKAPEVGSRAYDACYEMIYNLYISGDSSRKITVHTTGDMFSTRSTGCSISPL